MSQKSNYGWVVLTVYTLIAGVSQMLWLNFAPILSVIQEKYQVTEAMAGNLIMVFPLLYVFLAIPAGIWVDRAGYKFVVIVGSVLMSVSAILRIFDDQFLTLFIGQFGIAVAQPFILNAISKLVGDWFEEEQHALATGLGTVGMFVGMACGLAITPLLVNGTDIRYAMIVYAATTVIFTLAFVLLARENRELSDAEEGPTFEIRELLKNKNLVLLFIVSFLALGYFNGLTTWLELILAEQNINSEEAGLVGGLLIIGGIIGSIILPAISDKIGKRKPFLLLAGVVGIALVYPLTRSSDMTLLLLLGGLTGALFLPGYAMLLTMTEEEAGAKKAGAATGMMFLAGNTGSVVIIVLMEAVRSAPKEWVNSIFLLIAVMILCLLVILGVKETYSKKSKV